MSELSLIGKVIDSCGLAIEIPADQLDAAAEQLGVVDGAIGLAKADLYIRKCEVLEIDPKGGRPEKNSPDVGRVMEEIETFCATLGESRKQLENWASICRAWPRGDRVIGMTIGHYDAVAGMDRGEARELLQRAQMGDPKTEWSEHKPPKPWKMWSVARLRKERKAQEGDAEAKIESDVTSAAIDTKHEILKDVAKALGADTKKNRKIMSKIERGVEKAFKTMADDFKNTLRIEVAKEVNRERRLHADAVREADSSKTTYEEAIKGIARPIESAEFKILRQFCHPDKHPGNEAKAGQAYEIVMAIGDRLQLAKKTG